MVDSQWLMKKSMYRSRIPIAVLLGALIAVAGDAVAFADSLNVTAVLTSSETVLGEPVQLQIRVTGARGADAPDEIVADGLEIHRTGTSQHFEMNNFNVTSSVVYDYTVMPLKAGTFTIPPQRIRVGGNALSTPALRLNVADSPGSSSASRPRQGAQPGNAGKLVFAELIVPKKMAYVGEIVPAEIGPVKAKAQVVVSRSRRSPRTRSPFDLFNMDDPFSDPFFANPLSQFGERREIEIKSEPVTLEVKPLPTGAPPGFSGAIGNFTMA